MNEDRENYLLDNVKDKLDALIEKGLKLSKDLGVEEKSEIISKVVHDCLNEAIESVLKSGGEAPNKEEFSNKIDELKKLIGEYIKAKIV